ncbi:hypothetical protein NDU88_001574 [Pleurodeles waltl]|uniref:Uncharacterized protein n=1 Tax=Pleurodeles waltl TaxID=8319 RepID=A0AAV7V859_PLEWA|nr:hypothetical protein NDU88_001574 [Pleurodeles waltl]
MANQIVLQCFARYDLPTCIHINNTEWQDSEPFEAKKWEESAVIAKSALTSVCAAAFEPAFNPPRLKYVCVWNPRCSLARRRFKSALPGLFTDPLLLIPVPVAEVQNGAPVPRVCQPGRLTG